MSSNKPCVLGLSASKKKVVQVHCGHFTPYISKKVRVFQSKCPTILYQGKFVCFYKTTVTIPVNIYRITFSSRSLRVWFLTILSPWVLLLSTIFALRPCEEANVILTRLISGIRKHHDLSFFYRLTPSSKAKYVRLRPKSVSFIPSQSPTDLVIYVCGKTPASCSCFKSQMINLNECRADIVPGG